MSDLQTLLANDLRAKGCTITSSPDSACYWIQANGLKAEKMDLRTAQAMLGGGYEGAATGAALGAGISACNGNSGGAVSGTGLASGVAGLAADALVEDVNFPYDYRSANFVDIGGHQRFVIKWGLLCWSASLYCWAAPFLVLSRSVTPG